MRRLPMRKIGEALRLRASGRTMREIGISLGAGRSAVSAYLKRAKAAGLTWLLPEGLSEADLERRLFPPKAASRRTLAEPDWPPSTVSSNAASR